MTIIRRSKEVPLPKGRWYRQRFKALIYFYFIILILFYGVFFLLLCITFIRFYLSWQMTLQSYCNLNLGTEFDDCWPYARDEHYLLGNINTGTIFTYTVRWDHCHIGCFIDLHFYIYIKEIVWVSIKAVIIKYSARLIFNIFIVIRVAASFGLLRHQHHEPSSFIFPWSWPFRVMPKQVHHKPTQFSMVEVTQVTRKSIRRKASGSLHLWILYCVTELL